MIIDILLFAFLIFSAVSGFRNGFIPSLLSLIGYFGGGVAGLFVAKEIAANWQSLPSVILLLIVAIFIGAQIGRMLAKGLGRGLRSLMGPLKVFDGLLGAIVTFARALLLIYFLVFVVSLTSWDMGTDAAEDSLIVAQINQRVPSSLAKLLDEVANIIRR